MKVKTVKAWAVIDVKTGDIETIGEGQLMIFDTANEAGWLANHATKDNLKSVPCEIRIKGSGK